MDECERFIARQEPWIQSVLTGAVGNDESATATEVNAALAQPGGIETLNKATDEYEELLKHCRKHLSEYRKQRKKQATQSALFGVPELPVGAPRKDWLADECSELERRGKSQTEIADELNLRYPNLTDRKGNRRAITVEVVRKQLAALRKRAPEKT